MVGCVGALALGLIAVGYPARPYTSPQVAQAGPEKIHQGLITNRTTSAARVSNGSGASWEGARASGLPTPRRPND
jgi:hypothetical protein